ncbi:hypothetical protein [Actinomyces mediterranea]|uniref:hypothetical protein n=1 Tax=Actinomyces mediterranea TaxID=1871028 RepID=UPI0009709C46|nr:hypothetical protein [Actinomyces mediterranea]
MPNANGSLSPKPWWRTRKNHSAPGPGSSVNVFLRNITFNATDREACILDSITLGFRSGSFTAIVDPTLAHSRVLLLIIAGLLEPTLGSIDVRSQRSGRMAAVALVHRHSTIDASLTVRQNLFLPLAATGTVSDWGRLNSAVSLASLAERLSDRADSLPPIDRFRLEVARAIVSGGDVILVEDPTHLPSRADHASAISLLKSVATHGSTVILSTASPATAAAADRAVVLTSGMVVDDLVPADEAAIGAALQEHVQNPATLLGPIPSAQPPVDDAVPVEAEADDDPMVPPFHPLDGDYDNIGRVGAQPDDQDESSPAFTAWLTRMSARMGEGADDDAESGNGTASAIDMAAEERYPTAPTPAQQLPPVAQGFPRQRATRHREPDPITQAIRIHAQAAQENAPERPSADEVSALLAAQRPASTTPTPEQAQIIDKARQILNDLPGPVVPED